MFSFELRMCIGSRMVARERAFAQMWYINCRHFCSECLTDWVDLIAIILDEEKKIVPPSKYQMVSVPFLSAGFRGIHRNSNSCYFCALKHVIKYANSALAKLIRKWRKALDLFRWNWKRHFNRSMWYLRAQHSHYSRHFCTDARL